MDVYCNIVKTIIPYGTSLNYLRHIELGEDAKQGDIIINYIISSSGNPTNLFKEGHVVAGFPIALASIIETNRDDLELEDFDKYKISDDVWRYIRNKIF